MKILSLLNGNIVTLKKSDAAAKKNFHTYELLAKEHDITILANVSCKEHRKVITLNDNLRIIPVCLYYPTLLYYLDKPGILPSAVVHSVHRFCSRLVRKYFQENYDLCIVDAFLLSAWLDLLPAKTKVVYAAHNVEFDWYRSILHRFVFSNFFQRYVFNIEKKLIERSSLVTAVSEVDKNRFVDLYRCDRNKIEIFPIGFNRDDFMPPTGLDMKQRMREKYKISLDKNIVLFCGSNFYANQEGVDYIIRQISPGLKAGIEIVIAGSISHYISKQYLSLPENIRVLGFVENITEVYQAADVALNPIGSGSGTNVKTIESLGAGLDLISTEFGIRGYEPLRNNILIGDLQGMAQVINNYFSRGKKKMSHTLLKDYEWNTIVPRLSRRLMLLFQESGDQPCKPDELFKGV